MSINFWWPKSDSSSIVIVFLIASSPIFISSVQAKSLGAQKPYQDGRKVLREYQQFLPDENQLVQESLTYSTENYEQLRQDWVRRQSQKYFPDLERRWIEVANERLRSVVTLFTSLSDSADSEAESRAEDTSDSSQKSLFKGSKTREASESRSTKKVGSKKNDQAQKPAARATEKKSSAMRFSRINAMEYRLDDGSEFSMLLDPTGARLNYFRNINRAITYGIEHTSNNSQTLFIYRYGF